MPAGIVVYGLKNGAAEYRLWDYRGTLRGTLCATFCHGLPLGKALFVLSVSQRLFPSRKFWLPSFFVLVARVVMGRLVLPSSTLARIHNFGFIVAFGLSNSIAFALQGNLSFFDIVGPVTPLRYFFFFLYFIYERILQSSGPSPLVRHA